MNWPADRHLEQDCILVDEDVQVATATSLESFAREETIRQMQEQLNAQAKQVQAQTQLAIQARLQLKALEGKLLNNANTPKPNENQAL